MKPLVGEGREPLLVLVVLLGFCLLPLAAFGASFGIAFTVGLVITLICCASGAHRITRRRTK